MHWKKFVVLFHDLGQKKLCFKEFAYVNDEMARVDSDHLSALAYRNDAVTHVVTADVIDFHVESPRQGQAWISVTTERRWDQTFRSNLRFMVTMRN